MWSLPHCLGDGSRAAGSGQTIRPVKMNRNKILILIEVNHEGIKMSNMLILHVTSNKCNNYNYNYYTIIYI